MQAYGADKLRRGNGEQWILLSPRSKGWLPRTPKSMTSAERPGSAVLWDEQHFEVVSAMPSGDGVRYVLEPWRDEHIMRTVDAYDAASELARDAEHRARIARTRGRGVATATGILAGHLPAAVQERLASELGVIATRLTILSLIPVPFAIAVILNEHVGRTVARETPLPAFVLFLTGYVFIESAIRLNIVLSQSRPIGSAAGYVAYAIFYALAPNRRSLPPLVETSKPSVVLEIDPDVEAHDAFRVREALLTLLTPAEQQRAAQRYGYDYRKTAPGTAWLILIASTIGSVSSWITFQESGRISSLVALVVAAALVVEQVIRLHAFRTGPAGSILGTLVRPLARKVVQ